MKIIHCQATKWVCKLVHYIIRSLLILKRGRLYPHFLTLASHKKAYLLSTLEMTIYRVPFWRHLLLNTIFVLFTLRSFMCRPFYQLLCARFKSIRSTTRYTEEMARVKWTIDLKIVQRGNHFHFREKKKDL